jgi:hypothetical protein
MPKDVSETLQGRFADEQSWDQIVDWYCGAMRDFYKVLFPYWEKVQRD